MYHPAETDLHGGKSPAETDRSIAPANAIQSDIEMKVRGPMILKFKTAAAALMAVALVATAAHASDPTPTVKKHVATKKAANKPAGPTVEEQIETLRQALANQGTEIESLKSNLSDKDARLKQAEQAAADAENAAAKAQATASAGQQSVTENAAAVNTLQGAVTDLKADQTTLAVKVQKVSVNLQSPPNPTEPGAPAAIATAPSKSVNSAISPVRVFPVGSVEVNRKPAFKAAGVGFDPYGFIKSTAVWDSSDPDGDDFPLPGFLTTEVAGSAIGGPNGDPEFHVKARSSRVGLNFSIYDPNPKWNITGKLEMDFEGNFNRSDNRNVSTIRSSNPSLRLAYGRMDYSFDKNNTISALFGQDWSLYATNTIPNILETTFFGAYYGILETREAQMRVGFAHKSGGFTMMPEFSINVPASGIPPAAADISQQLGYGEREGPDSDRPNYQARLLGEWQLDSAKGVAPAQVIVSAFNGKRASNVTAAEVPAAYATTFAKGVTGSSVQDGWDGGFQLPTRWFTLVGNYYDGSDLRWFFAGQAYSYYNDTTGLTAVTTATAEDGNSIDFGTTASGVQEVVPERPVRAAGGFVQLGLPLSRIFNANPAGRNAGWTLYATYGVDQAKQRDADKAAGAGASRHQGSMAAGTLNYSLNKWLSFSFEQTLYTEKDQVEVGRPLPTFKGHPSREWNDVREEFGPVFLF